MKCERCNKELSPLEAVLSKYPVCGKCVRERHREALGMSKKKFYKTKNIPTIKI